MRGRKAKELRNLTQLLNPDLEPKLYDLKSRKRFFNEPNKNKVLDSDPEFIQREWIPFVQVKLADCQRLRYQRLKSDYKKMKSGQYNHFVPTIATQVRATMAKQISNQQKEITI